MWIASPIASFRSKSLQLDLAFLQQATQVPDDVARTLIVPSNIGEDVPQLTQVGRIHREEGLGRLGVAQDRAHG